MNHLTRIEEEPYLHFSIDAKGMRAAFIDGQVIDDVVVNEEQEGGLYKLKGYPEQALIHDTVEPNELWNYIALPFASKAVEGLPEFQAI